jgi:hypothetical protein
MKALIGALVGATIGGVTGGGIWMIVALAAGQNAGWIAIVTGALVGLGTRMGGSGLNGAFGGLIAAAFALGACLIVNLVIAASAVVSSLGHSERDQWVLVNLAQMAAVESGSLEPDERHVESAQERFRALSAHDLRRYRALPGCMAPDYPRVYMAEQVLEEYVGPDKELVWPAGYSVNTAWLPQHFPKELWADVQQRWDSMTLTARGDYIRAVEADVNRRVEQYYRLPGVSDPTAAAASGFAGLDLVWFAIAVVFAFGIGCTTDR